MQFKEALVIEFCMMFIQVRQNQLDFVNSKKKKKILVVDSFAGFVSDFSMSFDKFQNCSKLFPFIHWWRESLGRNVVKYSTFGFVILSL